MAFRRRSKQSKVLGEHTLIPSSSSLIRHTSLRLISMRCCSSSTTPYKLLRSLTTRRRTPSPVSCAQHLHERIAYDSKGGMGERTEIRSAMTGRYLTATSGRATTYLPTSSIAASRTDDA